MTIQPWGIRNLTEFPRHPQFCSFPPVNPAKDSHQACRLPASVGSGSWGADHFLTFNGSTKQASIRFPLPAARRFGMTIKKAPTKQIGGFLCYYSESISPSRPNCAPGAFGTPERRTGTSMYSSAARARRVEASGRERSPATRSVRAETQRRYRGAQQAKKKPRPKSGLPFTLLQRNSHFAVAAELRSRRIRHSHIHVLERRESKAG